MKLYFEKRNWKIINQFPKLEDGIYEIKKVEFKRSIKLNNLYWLRINCIVEEYSNYGYIHTPQFIHNKFKRCFLQKEKIKSDFSKKYVYKIWSTANLNNKKFVKYLEKIQVIVEFWKLWEIDWLEEISWFVLPEPWFNI